MNTLSFEEFLDAAGKGEVYNKLDLYGESKPEEYEEVKSFYKIYCQIGGYPAVVKKYLETQMMTYTKIVIKISTPILRLTGFLYLVILFLLSDKHTLLQMNDKHDRHDRAYEKPRIIRGFYGITQLSVM